MSLPRAAAILLVLFLASGACRRGAAPDEDSTNPPPRPSRLSQAADIESEYATAPLANDPDGPAIWVHPQDPARSLILGTMKVAAPAGAIVAFAMDRSIAD